MAASKGHLPNYAELTPDQVLMMNRKLAPTGLAYRSLTCGRCGRHIVDEAVPVSGFIRWRCPRCKFPNEVVLDRMEEVKD